MKFNTFFRLPTVGQIITGNIEYCWCVYSLRSNPPNTIIFYVSAKYPNWDGNIFIKISWNRFVIFVINNKVCKRNCTWQQKNLINVYNYISLYFLYLTLKNLLCIFSPLWMPFFLRALYNSSNTHVKGIVPLPIDDNIMRNCPLMCLPFLRCGRFIGKTRVHYRGINIMFTPDCLNNYVLFPIVHRT